MATDKERRMLIRPLTHYLLGVYCCPGRWANEVELATIVMPLFGGWDYVHGRAAADGRTA